VKFMNSAVLKETRKGKYTEDTECAEDAEKHNDAACHVR